MIPLLFRRSGGGPSSATEVGAAAATAVLLSVPPAFWPLPLLLLVLLLLLLLPPASWEPPPRLDMVGPRPRPRCWESLQTAGGSELSTEPGCPQYRCLQSLRQGRHMVRCPRGNVFTRLRESSEPPRSPRGRGGGAGRGAALRSGHRRGALRSSRPPRPGPEPESRRRGWPEAGRGGEPAAPAPPPPPRGPN